MSAPWRCSSMLAQTPNAVQSSGRSKIDGEGLNVRGVVMRGVLVDLFGAPVARLAEFAGRVVDVVGQQLVQVAADFARIPGFAPRR